MRAGVRVSVRYGITMLTRDAGMPMRGVAVAAMAVGVVAGMAMGVVAGVAVGVVAVAGSMMQEPTHRHGSEPDATEGETREVEIHRD